MASIVWPQNDAANLVSITVGTTKFVWPSYSSSEETANSVLPVTIAAAMEVCTEDSQDISWEFR